MLSSKKVHGVITASVTPMRSGKICWESYEKILAFQMLNGVNGVLVNGSTGESPTLSKKEKAEVLKFAKEKTAGNIRLYAGATHNSTETAMGFVKDAQKAGVDAVICGAPYYNKPTQEGIYRHYAALAESTDVPMILYSNPGRSVVEIEIDTVLRLKEKYPQIMGLKESSMDTTRVLELTGKTGDEFVVVSGIDNMTIPFMSVGAHGVVSVASNYLPSEMVSMVNAIQEGNYQQACAINRKEMELFNMMFIEPNPVPIKYIMYKAGLIEAADVRLPLCPLEKKSQEELERLLSSRVHELSEAV